jgi:hypothetical protein
LRWNGYILRQGRYTPLGVVQPYTDMIRIQKVVDGVLAQSGTLALLLIAIGCYWLYSLIGEAMEQLTPKEAN